MLEVRTTGMALTYQPFESSAALHAVATDLKMNVGDTERVLSGIAGFGILAGALRSRGFSRWSLLVAGAALLARSWSGYCPWYRSQQLDRRHPASGVPGNRGIKIESAIEVRRSPEVLFQFWRDLEQLPQVVRQLASVKQYSSRRSHWRISYPLGQTIEWDAEIINEEAPDMIAWRSLPGAVVPNAGSVWFEPTQFGTRVKVTLEFDPPAGKVGALLAEIAGASPETQLAEALANFKQFAEKELEPLAVVIRSA